MTFNWSERQADYSLVKRSHTQLVEKLPAPTTINVGGADHPVVKSLTINPKGARGDVKSGYSDGKDAGGEKWVGKWVTYGKNLAQGKPYTLSVPPSENNWDAGDPETEEADRRPRRLELLRRHQLQGRPALEREAPSRRSPSTSATRRRPPRSASTSTATRRRTRSRAKVKDEVEVLVSNDGKDFKPAGKFDFNLRWKDIPVNYMWTDEETVRRAQPHAAARPAGRGPLREVRGQAVAHSW